MYYTSDIVSNIAKRAKRTRDNATLSMLSSLIPESNIKDVFQLRYLEGEKWRIVCDRLFISTKTAHRWNEKAIEFITRKLNRMVELGHDTGIGDATEPQKRNIRDRFIDSHYFGVRMDDPEQIRNCLSCQHERCIRGCNGYPEYITQNERKVVQIDAKTGRIIKIHPSIDAAYEETGARCIRQALAGQIRTSGGFVWKNYDEMEAANN